VSRFSSGSDFGVAPDFEPRELDAFGKYLRIGGTVRVK
jgi:hypothetical protein